VVGLGLAQPTPAAASPLADVPAPYVSLAPGGQATLQVRALAIGPGGTLPGAGAVVGDLAALKDPSGQWLPGLAPVATQEGETAAKNIARTLRGAPTMPFHYRDRGDIATIGRNRAVAVVYGVKTRGFIAWAIRVFIHILTLIGYRNRFAVMAQWTYAYFTHRRPARLIRAERT